jgi:hypothetical protein
VKHPAKAKKTEQKKKMGKPLLVFEKKEIWSNINTEQ